MKNQKCLRTTQLVSMEQDADLPLQERLTMRLHLLACADCRNFRKNAASLRRIMQRYGSGDEASTSKPGFPAPTADEGNRQPRHGKDADRH